MDLLRDLVLNYYFLSFIITWVISISLKALLKSLNRSKQFNFLEGFENGGMPSSHSAVVTALTMAVLLKTGFSSIFFICVVFSSIIISDAYRLRMNVGIQGQELNILLKKSKQKPIKVLYGHTFMQVIGGIVIGAVISLILFLI